MNSEETHKKTISEKETDVLNFWQDEKIFEKTIKNPGKRKEEESHFTFYDGPPFATGLPHNGHLLISTIKDSIARFNTMNGKTIRRVWGWDCHGLPIEELIERKFELKSKKDIEDFGIEKFTKACEDSVFLYEKEWKKIIPRIGRFVDMEKSYKTMDATYTESVWWAFKQIHEKGYVYEGYKIMYICPRCETTLSQNEVSQGYEDLTDLSATVKFKLANHENKYFLAWTTTPWTLPGNTALAVNSNLKYLEVLDKETGNTYILAKDLVEKVLKEKDIEIVSEKEGLSYVGENYIPPFNYYSNNNFENKENIYKVWAADFVTAESGTGIVHIAPAFGEDDMNLAKVNNIPVIKHVKFNGEFEDAVIDFASKKVKQKGDNISTDIEIIKYLAHNNILFSKEKIVHSYPTCWRCKTPLLNYATNSWFIDVPKIKEKLLEENQKINWVPDHIKNGRFGKWLEGAREWSVSRSRYWGAAMPIWKSVDGQEIKVVGSLDEIAQKPKNKYIFVRHGEAKSNVLNILDSGSMADNNLTEKGVEQIMATANTLNGDFDMIFSSPVLRAKQSAEILAKGKEINYDDRLREIGMGVLDTQSRSNYISACKESDIDFFDFRVKNGETHREAQQRISSLLLELEDKYDGKKIVIVTHGGPALSTFLWANNFEPNEVYKIICNDYLYLQNGEMRELEWKKVCYDDKFNINIHRPYIDQIKLKDSRGIEMTRISDVFDCWFESGSMPFAQMHYPFDNKEMFDKNYPADFIVEGLDQTRGWFYSMLVVNKMIFDKSPFKNVITSGLLMAADGQKMSKSLKNYTDPMLLVEKYGADALRFSSLSTSATRGENAPFSDSDVEEVYKKNISRLENVLQFFSLYKNENIIAENNSENVLDRWMFNRIYETSKNVAKGFEDYKMDESVKPIDKIIDDLSTWYLRRSRDRFKSEGKEKEEALSAFKFILVNISKIIAPSMPFLAERVYREAGGELDSVHLESWPENKSVDQDILSDMDKARNFVTKALLVRQMNAVKVRQPLATLKIKEALKKDLLEIVREEINVISISVDNSISEDVELDLNISPELKELGNKREFLRAVQDLRKAKKLTPRDVVKFKSDEVGLKMVDQDFMVSAKIVETEIGQDLSNSIEIDGVTVYFDLDKI
jgi:isoleucyl-tRNA synthetase